MAYIERQWKSHLSWPLFLITIVRNYQFLRRAPAPTSLFRSPSAMKRASMFNYCDAWGSYGHALLSFLAMLESRGCRCCPFARLVYIIEYGHGQDQTRDNPLGSCPCSQDFWRRSSTSASTFCYLIVSQYLKVWVVLTIPGLMWYLKVESLKKAGVSGPWNLKMKLQTTKPLNSPRRLRRPIGGLLLLK